MMKLKFSALVFAAFILFSAKGLAQKVITEGMLVYKISAQDLKTQKPVAGMLNGATLTVYFTRDKSRAELTSAAGTETSVFSSSDGKGFILKEYSGQKLEIMLNADDWKEKNHVYTTLVFKTDNTAFPKGAYNCKKASAIAADGKEYTVYFEPSTLIANKTYNDAFPQLNGLPVEYNLRSGDIVFQYTLLKYDSEPVDAAKFSAPKTGFRVMTYGQNKDLKKIDGN